MIADNILIDQLVPQSVLKDGDLVLYPATLKESEDYILKMACKDKYNVSPKEQLARGLQFVKYTWIAKNEDGVGGVLFMCYLEHMSWWTLDAYKEDSVNNRGDWSFRAGRLVIDWFFRNHNVQDLYTIHKKENHAATKLCERLGFKARYTNPQFTIFRIRRNLWV